MKYSNMIVTGHQRSGTHYITALISLNFLNNKDYVKIYKNHQFPNIVRNNNIAYIYTWRDFDSIAKSIFTMRKVFGLNVIDFKTFLEMKYCHMWKSNKNSVVNVNDLKGNLRKTNYVSKYFRKRKYTPKEWWNFYYGKWEAAEKKHSNIIRVSYNNIINDFDNTMLYIENKLGMKGSHFKKISEKVGWYI